MRLILSVGGRWRAPVLASVAAACLCIAAAARSELPPDVYRERQQRAPEALEIKVRSVKSEESRKSDHTLIAQSVEAVVEKVERSATDLKPGTAIRILYTQRRYDKPMVGPSELPTLKEGQICPAYVAWMKEAEIYAPAAGGQSFNRINP